MYISLNTTTDFTATQIVFVDKFVTIIKMNILFYRQYNRFNKILHEIWDCEKCQLPCKFLQFLLMLLSPFPALSGQVGLQKVLYGRRHRLTTLSQVLWRVYIDRMKMCVYLVLLHVISSLKTETIHILLSNYRLTGNSGNSS